MKIIVKSFLTLRKEMGDRASLEIKVDALTIRELLEMLCDRFGETFTNMIFEPGTHVENGSLKILLNGRHFRHAPNKLDTPLKNGDEVYIFPIMAGG